MSLFLACPALAQKTGTLTVEVGGLSDDKGQVIAALFDNAFSFPFDQNTAKRLFTADISGRASRVVFKDIPYGRYAVLIAHDKDFSNTMKFRARFPAEGYGTSNNYDAGLAGLSFDASSFMFSSPEETISVTARYGSAADRISFPHDRLARTRGRINVKVEGLRNSKGNVLAALFATEEGFPFEAEKAALRTYGMIAYGKTEFPIEDVPYGDYALVLFHDESADGRFDLLPNGAPAEGYGIPGNRAFRYGPPTFPRASFRLKEPAVEFAITMVYETACSRINFPDDRMGNPKGDIAVRVSNVKKVKGWVMGALFPAKKGFPAGLDHASMLTYAPAEYGRTELKFPGVPYGEYAIAVFHDANQDGKFNRFLGVIPAEQYGASNNAVRKFGPPKYERARFHLEKPRLDLNIGLK
ncbi:MAG: DUF2141 domain-containing protein [Elusimicrobiales bacterium]|nr:DUF2141 domain-containing protein [Elusimicrobiales bacterium]